MASCFEGFRRFEKAPPTRPLFSSYSEMTTTVSPDSSENQEIPIEKKFATLEDNPWVEYALHQAQILQNTLLDTTDSAVRHARSRLSEIRYTSSAHFHQTLEGLETIKDQFRAYEDVFFGKIKEGVFLAASHPVISCGVGAGLGVVIFKKPRRSLFHRAEQIFMSEESLISKADARVKELRKAIDNVKFESKVLEESTLQAEEEMERGRTKLRQAGRQIQGVIRSAYKIERQARGLKDILGELPGRESSRFRAQVSSLASDVKKEKVVLAKEVSKVTNYGISI